MVLAHSEAQVVEDGVAVPVLWLILEVAFVLEDFLRATDRPRAQTH